MTGSRKRRNEELFTISYLFSTTLSKSHVRTPRLMYRCHRYNIYLYPGVSSPSSSSFFAASSLSRVRWCLKARAMPMAMRAVSEVRMKEPR